MWHRGLWDKLGCRVGCGELVLFLPLLICIQCSKLEHLCKVFSYAVFMRVGYLLAVAPLIERDNEIVEVEGDIEIGVEGYTREPEIVMLSQALHALVHPLHRINYVEVGGPEGKVLLKRRGKMLEVQKYSVPPRGRVVVYQSQDDRETAKILW